MEEMQDNQGGGVGAFAEEEANKKRQKKEDSVSFWSLNGSDEPHLSRLFVFFSIVLAIASIFYRKS